MVHGGERGGKETMREGDGGLEGGREDGRLIEG